MAITRNAKKAYRSSLKKRVYNVRRKTTLHDAIKTYKDTLTKGKEKDAAALLPSVYQAIDKATKRGILKKNAANRTKSRLTAKLKTSAKK
jgi:small subunit ribosomal protein S20